ncbi:MAG: ABC transporter permease [Bacillota bacterium]
MRWRRLQRLNTIAIGILKKIVFYLGLILIWELAYKLGVDYLGIWKPYMFPSPLDVVKTLFALIDDHTLAVAIAASMKRIIIGYCISVVIGVLIALVMLRIKYLSENLSSLILGLQTLPSITWLPFAILWFGLKESSIIFVIAIGSTFAISIATESAIKNINPVFLRAAKTMGAKGANAYWNVIMPAALPNIITGMKQGWSFAWRALMAGEMLSATKGLGQVLMVGRDLADINQVVAVMVIIIFIGLAVDKLLFGRVENNLRYKWGLDRT